MDNRQSVIILHGWQSSKENWSRVKEIIEKEEVKVFVPDLPGFKEETKLEKAWNLENYLNWLENFIETKKNSGEITEPFFLLGHSFGGRISIKFSVKNPQKLKGLILVSSAGIRHKKKPSKLIPYLKKLSFFPFFPFLRKIYYKFIIRKTDYLRVEGVLKETFKKTIEEDLTPFLSKIKVKTLILWGDRDKITLPADAYLMKEKIENSKLEIMEGINHTPYLENPELLSRKILEFISL